MPTLSQEGHDAGILAGQLAELRTDFETGP